MIDLIIDLIKSGLNFFIKKQTIEHDLHQVKKEGQIEVNKVEIEKSTLHWRNFLGFVLSLIILYNWIIVPVLDAFGIVVIQIPLGQLLQVLLIMVGN